MCMCECVGDEQQTTLHVHVHVCMCRALEIFIYPDHDQAVALACELYTPELHAMHIPAKSEALGQMPTSQLCALEFSYVFFGGSTLGNTIPASTPNLIPCVVITPFQ